MKKQSDGRYRSKVTVGHMDGKPIIKYASGRTKKELAENVEELKRAYIGGQSVRRDVMFCEYAVEWYEAYKKPKLSQSSRDCYASTFNQHIIPAFDEKQFRALSPNDLQEYMNSKSSECMTTIGYIYSIITNVCKHATVHGVIDRDPSIALVKPAAKKNKRRALTENEIKATLRVGREHEEGLLLLLLFYTGLRIGEVVGLQWGDIDFTNRMISVVRDIDYKTNNVGALKTRYSERKVPIPAPLYDALQPRRGTKHTYVLQSPQTHSFLPQATLKRRWQRLMTALYKADSTIEHDANGASILTAHYYRHNYASTLYDADVDILSAQRFLGHADVKTTLSIYSHLSQGKEDKNAEKAREAFANY